MNFFGHAWVAGWQSESGPFILGSMLPDLANALRVSAPHSLHLELCAGVRFHHETDRAFHATGVFRTLEAAAVSALAALGLPKGARRALGHIGVEFLIDEQLARGAPAWNGYATALQFGSSEACGLALQWESASSAERFATLCRRLAAFSGTFADTDGLAPRLVAALAGRPRLELGPEHVPLLGPWLAEYRPSVAALMPDLLAELGRELGAERGAR